MRHMPAKGVGISDGGCLLEGKVHRYQGVWPARIFKDKSRNSNIDENLCVCVVVRWWSVLLLWIVFVQQSSFVAGDSTDFLSEVCWDETVRSNFQSKDYFMHCCYMFEKVNKYLYIVISKNKERNVKDMLFSFLVCFIWSLYHFKISG
jgi:hypothetical protein